MIDDDLETQLARASHAEALPTAPISLRQTLADLPVHDLQGQGRHRSGLVLFAAATLILAGLGAGALLVGVSPQPLPTKDASTATRTSRRRCQRKAPAPAPASRLATFNSRLRESASHPPDWHLSTAVDRIIQPTSAFESLQEIFASEGSRSAPIRKASPLSPRSRRVVVPRSDCAWFADGADLRVRRPTATLGRIRSAGHVRWISGLDSPGGGSNPHRSDQLRIGAGRWVVPDLGVGASRGSRQAPGRTGGDTRHIAAFQLA